MDLKVSFSGRWQWTPSRPRPAWSKLKLARVWTSPKFQNLRESLRRPPLSVQQFPSGHDDVIVLSVKNKEKDEETDNTVKMYRVGEGDQRDAVPQGLSSDAVGVVMYRCEGVKRPPLHVLTAAEGGALILAWGKVGEVSSAAGYLKQKLTDVDVVTIDYYIKGEGMAIPGKDLQLMKKMALCIVSGKENRRGSVCV
jgi:hypothetical protein